MFPSLMGASYWNQCAWINSPTHWGTIHFSYTTSPTKSKQRPKTGSFALRILKCSQGNRRGGWRTEKNSSTIFGDSSVCDWLRPEKNNCLAVVQYTHPPSFSRERPKGGFGLTAPIVLRPHGCILIAAVTETFGHTRIAALSAEIISFSSFFHL